MTLQDLLEKLDYTCLQGSLQTDITALAYDSRSVEKGSCFVCISGTVTDGHAFIPDALKNGAAALIVEKEVNVPEDVAVIKVKDARRALALASAAYFGYPAEKLRVIGVTGTKGKTTTTYMIHDMLTRVGFSVGLIGTIEIIIGEKHIPAGNTTPESYLLQQYLAEMVKAGVSVVVMEVSSQGLKLHRTDGIPFEVGIFTNLSEDHIGAREHPDFEDYKYCKSLLFSQCSLGIGNIDDPCYEDIFRHATCRKETFGLSERADLYAKNMRLLKEPGYLGVAFETAGTLRLSVEMDMPGRFNVYNALAAMALCRHFGVSGEDMRRVLKQVRVKGRIEMMKVSDAFTLMIDYAHNAMALESLLATLKEYAPERLICLFGCGGDRAKSRRYEMGEVSGRLADVSIITSDNPRTEDPQAIIEDIKVGMAKTAGKYVEICDRREAIAYAIAHGQKGDVIVLAGKGHEDYQEINGVKYPMDEREIITDILKAKQP